MLLTSALRIWLTRSFAPFTFTDDNDPALAYQNTRQLGLYVHIPFCRSLCSFCPYCKEVYSPATAQRYKKALLQEIHLVGRMHPGKKL